MLTYEIVTAVSAASFSSSVPVDLGDLQGYSVAILVSGADVAGTFSLEGSNDQTTWVTIQNSSQAITVSDDVLYDVRSAFYRYFRLAFTYTSGTGNITAKVIVKQNVVTGC